VLLKVKVRKAASFCPWPGIRSYHWRAAKESRPGGSRLCATVPYQVKSAERECCSSLIETKRALCAPQWAVDCVTTCRYRWGRESGAIELAGAVTPPCLKSLTRQLCDLSIYANVAEQRRSRFSAARI